MGPQGTSGGGLFPGVEGGPGEAPWYVGNPGVPGPGRMPWENRPSIKQVIGGVCLELSMCAICSVFFKNSQEILLTSWAPGPQGPDCEKVGPFQAGPGSSSAMSPSLAHNLKDKRFGQKCFVLVYQAGWMVSILLAADSTSLNGLNCGESCFPQVAAMIEGL